MFDRAPEVASLGGERYVTRSNLNSVQSKNPCLPPSFVSHVIFFHLRPC